ncbi:MAG: type II toxin-antitoxin system YafQ family toxin [Prevotella sp.]|nr:type II toxin-antitoxin system YafQ family toxin [Prevotella sp.]
MKYSVDYTGRFKKSLKRCVKRGLDIKLLEQAVAILIEQGGLPKTYKPHKLSGNMEGMWECHIAPDWLLVWLQNDNKLTLLMLDTGSHSDLF